MFAVRRERMGSGASQLTDQHRGRWGEVRRRGERSDQFRIRARRARRCRGWAVWARRRRRARSARSPKETREWLISWIDKRIQYVAICLVLCLGKPCRSYSTLPVTCHPILMISLQRLPPTAPSVIRSRLSCNNAVYCYIKIYLFCIGLNAIHSTNYMP